MKVPIFISAQLAIALLSKLFSVCQFKTRILVDVYGNNGHTRKQLWYPNLFQLFLFQPKEMTHLVEHC